MLCTYYEQHETTHEVTHRHEDIIITIYHNEDWYPVTVYKYSYVVAKR